MFDNERQNLQRNVCAVTLKEAARLIGIAPKTLYNLRYLKRKGEQVDIPDFYRLSANGKLFVRVSELDAWISRLEVNSAK